MSVLSRNFFCVSLRRKLEPLLWRHCSICLSWWVTNHIAVETRSSHRWCLFCSWGIFLVKASTDLCWYMILEPCLLTVGCPVKECIVSDITSDTTFHYFVGADGSNAFWTRRFTGEWQVDNPAFQVFWNLSSGFDLGCFGELTMLNHIFAVRN